MSYCFRNGEKAVDVVNARENGARNLPGGGAGFGNHAQRGCLPLSNQFEIAIEKFFEIMNGVAMATKDKCRSETSHAGQTDKIFRQRAKSSRWIDRVGRDDRVWGDAFEHT